MDWMRLILSSWAALKTIKKHREESFISARWQMVAYQEGRKRPLPLLANVRRAFAADAPVAAYYCSGSCARVAALAFSTV